MKVALHGEHMTLTKLALVDKEKYLICLSFVSDRGSMQVLLLDECSQMTEPASLLPLAR